MKIELLCAAAVCAVAVVSCSSPSAQDANKSIDPANMDASVKPGDDFYQYADGGWMESNPLPAEYARFGKFDALSVKSQEQVRGIITEASQKANAAGSIEQKIGDLYSLAMDSARLNAEGAAPVKPYLDEIAQLSGKNGLTTLMAKLNQSGNRPFFSIYVGADDRNSSMNIMHLSQGGFSMGDRDYYSAKDEHSVMLRTKYADVIRTFFTLTGCTPDESNKAADAVMKIETTMANAAKSRVELRDPVANYHKITLAELQKLSPAIDWKLYFSSLGINGLTELNVSQLEPIAEVSKVINATPLQDLKYYLQWNVMRNAASYMSDAFSDANFEYFGKALSGRQAQSDRWKRAVDVVNRSMGEATGQLYVAKYFPPAAKEKMMTMVKNLQTALGERIQTLEWMSDATKTQAQAKLATFHIKIGYPDTWRDYSALVIDKNKTYLDNMLASSRFSFDYMISKFNKPVDINEWGMNPQTVNAYYNPSTNEICFPAGILQPPFFDMNADDAVNYGGIGVVIGHEMTHGFDDQGRQFDKDGNLRDWWTAEDAEKFNARASQLVSFFDNIIVIDTVHANGSLTLGENIADQGGLQVSWQAYQNTLKGKAAPAPIAGFTDAQRFFLGYATLWAQNIRPSEILRRTKTDPHSLGRWRVNGALPHIDAWYDAFSVTQDNKMYIAKDKRVALW
jgi:putative endopeptidase